MLSSESPKGGGDMQTDSSSALALPPNTNINSGSDPKVVIKHMISSKSKNDQKNEEEAAATFSGFRHSKNEKEAAAIRPPAMASSLPTLEIAPKSLEQTSLAPPTECKPSLDGKTPPLSELGLAEDCLSTTSADSAKATNDETWEDYDANFDVTQHSRILKSLKSIASGVDEDEDDTIFPIVTAESKNEILHLFVDNCN